MFLSSHSNAVSVAFQNIHVHDFSQRSDYQKTIASFLLAYLQRALRTPARMCDTNQHIERNRRRSKAWRDASSARQAR